MSEETEVVIEVDPLTAKLRELSVENEMIEKIKSDLGAASIDDLSILAEEDLIGIGMKKVPAKKIINALKATSPASVTDPATVNAAAVTLDNILPQVPNDESWLKDLKTGGALKIDQSTVISAIRATLAHRVGLFEIPSILARQMEEYADTSEEQVPAEFFSLRKQMTKRSYAEIFEAIDGLDGSFVTEARKKQLFERIDRNLWPAIINFYNQLSSWQEAWMQGAANPAIMMSVFMAASGGVGALPAGMMRPPDTGTLRDAADEVANAINKIFAGTGVQISSALAFDATKIREILTNPRLPTMIGAPNRDQMLRQLGVAVPATYPRMETNLTRFVLSILQVKDQPSGKEELQYFGALYMLGSQIPWDQLKDGNIASKKMTGIGAGNRRSEI